MNKIYLARLLIWIGYIGTSLSKSTNARFGPLLNLFHCGRWAGPFGHPGEPMSSVIGKVKRFYGGAIPKNFWIMRLIDRLLEWIDRRHSIDAIKDDRDPRWPQ